MEEFKAPKYLQVKQKIIHNIDNGSYKEKEAIPSERELITLFDVISIPYSRERYICKRGRRTEQFGIHHQLYAGH